MNWWSKMVWDIPLDIKSHKIFSNRPVSLLLLQSSYYLALQANSRIKNKASWAIKNMKIKVENLRTHGQKWAQTWDKILWY